MNIHEYQAKDILRDYGLPVPPGEVARTVDEARALAEKYGGAVMVKAQVHVGGRGKAGGVKFASNADEAASHASNILGMDIKGLTVEQVLVTPAEDIATEAYVGVIVDRGSKRPVFMVSREGGVDIEEVAERSPDAIRRLAVDARYGLLPFEAYWLAASLYDDVKQQRTAAKSMLQLYDAFIDSGASLAEINPLITTPAGEVKAIDAKMNIDDNELFRRIRVAELRDTSAEPPSEIKARDADLTYIKLDGNIGAVVNGAGLAMATMDLIKFYGGEPANFLDIGGSSNPDKVIAALDIITSDPSVRVILFNIFGGITRCDDVANGIVTALERMSFDLPLVIRLTGTNEAEGLRILDDAGISASTSMDEVVQRAVEVASGA
jgi:succinyl-CoA synthetase beta subunit